MAGQDFDPFGQGLTRRALLKQSALLAAAGVIGAPAIIRAAEPIRIGILQPFSGGLEALGEQGYQGAKLAVDEVNDKGGLLNRCLSLVDRVLELDQFRSITRLHEEELDPGEVRVCHLDCADEVAAEDLLLRV